jgi:hypothetical protein
VDTGLRGFRLCLLWGDLADGGVFHRRADYEKVNRDRINRPRSRTRAALLRSGHRRGCRGQGSEACSRGIDGRSQALSPPGYAVGLGKSGQVGAWRTKWWTDRWEAGDFCRDRNRGSCNASRDLCTFQDSPDFEIRVWAHRRRPLGIGRIAIYKLPEELSEKTSAALVA